MKHPVKQTKKKENRAGKKSSKDSQKWINFLLIPLVIITIAVFAKSTGNDFLVNWDDDGYILNNEQVQHLDVPQVRHIFTSFHMGNYPPLTTLSYAIEYAFYGANPRPYHVINLLLHLINILLVFVFITVLSRNRAVALITALVFALHPMHVESVAWISERKDVLYGVFFLMSLILYQLYAEGSKKYFYYVLSLLLFLMSLLSKSAAVSLPLVLFLIDYLKERSITLRSVAEKLPFVILSIVFGIIALQSQDAQAQQLTPNYTLINTFFVASGAFAFYIIKFFLPVNLSAFYPHPVAGGEGLPLYYYAAPLFIAALVLFIFLARKHRRILLFGLLFFLSTILLMLQIIPVGGAVVAERYTYIPYIGLAFVVASLSVSYFKSHTKALNALIIVWLGITIVFSVLSFNRSAVWANGITLFDDVTQKHPDAFYAYHSRGIAFYFEGNFQASLKDYNKAISLYDNYGFTHYNKGLTLMMLKDYEGALASFNRTIEIMPANEQAYNDRGIAYYNLNKVDEAILDYTKAAELNTENGRTFYNRGAAYYKLGDTANACADWNKSLELGIKQASGVLNKYCSQK